MLGSGNLARALNEAESQDDLGMACHSPQSLTRVYSESLENKAVIVPHDLGEAQGHLDKSTAFL